jgi:hypothetical protein
MPAIASDPIRLGTHPAAWNRVAAREDGGRTDAVLGRTSAITLNARARAVGRHHDADVTSSLMSWTTVMDGVTLLGVVWSIAVAVLVVGTPLALTIVFVLWVARLALAAF